MVFFSPWFLLTSWWDSTCFGILRQGSGFADYGVMRLHHVLGVIFVILVVVVGVVV